MSFRSIVLSSTVAFAAALTVSGADLDNGFQKDVRPFLEKYCLECHDTETKKAELDLSPYTTFEKVLKEQGYWELVLERLHSGDMPPKKSKEQPSAEERKAALAWIEQMRDEESHRTAGDPGPVLARRLSNSEYNYTIRDLTGVDIRPTKTFPVDPANQAGFDNSGESLSMSPALVKKYMQAAREVAEHAAFQPDGFTFAPHPVIADTDRDKWAVFRIVDFYRKQPTDYADYFFAAWKLNRERGDGTRVLTVEDVAKESKLSLKYLKLIFETLTGKAEEVGPLAHLQTIWRELPAGPNADPKAVRASCEEMRDYAARIRGSIVPEVKNLSAPGIQGGSQTLVMWKNRQMAANRRKFDLAALKIDGQQVLTNEVVEMVQRQGRNNNRTNYSTGRTNRVQRTTPSIVQKGGVSLAPVVLTKESSATQQMAKKRGDVPELIIPDPAQREIYEAAFARFADIFPDAFYITERARVYLDAEKEQENAGRLLSAGLHSMTGYFRDDGPLYDLILDESGRRELDRLWDEFDFISSVPQRMHISLLWFERTDSAWLRDPEFDPYRPEDKSATSQEKIKKLAEIYLAKAQRREASETVQSAVKEHFDNTAKNVALVEKMRLDAEPGHLKELEKFAERAYRRPLIEHERTGLRAFYQASRTENGADHEEAMRDCITRILVSPNFLFRMDMVEATALPAVDKPAAAKTSSPQKIEVQPLSDHALANRLSYFLWASMPDDQLLKQATAGKLRQPETLRAEVHRMLKHQNVRNLAAEFGGNWLDFRRFDEINSVDRERFPEFTSDLRTAMFEEPLRFFMDVANRDRSVLDFIYARDTFVNGPLAKHYKISNPPSGTNNWVHIENAREAGRGGVLPMAAFLTANSPGLRTSPVKRGNWVVKRILGERIPPPPPIVPELPKDEKEMGALTVRETLAKHRERVGCMECHARFDSFGLVFESFGPVGERRDVDLGGRSVDTKAEFPGGSTGEGLEGLLSYIKANRQDDFINNLCRKMLSYSLGRTLILGDEPLIKEMKANLVANEYRFSSLVETIVTSPQFLNKRANPSLTKN